MEQIGLSAIIETSKFDRGIKRYYDGITKMQQATDKLVRGSVTVRDAEGNMIKYSTSTAQAAASSDKASMSIGQMVTKMAALAAAYGVVTKAQEFALESFNAARAQNDIKGALVGVVGGLDQYNKLIEAARVSTRGMVSETNLANAGMVLLKSGIAGSAEEVGRLSAAGTALVNTYSAQGASQEKLVRFLLTGNRALMDNFNITAQQIAQMQAQIEAEGVLTGQEAKLAAIKALVIQEGEKLLGSVSAETIQVGQATAAWADFTAAFGQVMIALNQATNFLPTMTAFFGQLTTGAQSWTYVINEAIPAIQAHNEVMTQQQSSLAAQGAQLAIAAKNQADYTEALGKGLTDLDAFQSALASGVDSYEQYNQIVSQVTQGNYTLAASLSMSESEFNKTRQAAEDSAQATVKQANAAYVADQAAQVQATAQLKVEKTARSETLALNESVTAIQDLVIANQSLNAWLQEVNERRRESIALQQTLGVMGQFGGEIGGEVLSTGVQQQQKLEESANKTMVESFDKAADQLRSTIESVIKPSLSEVWQPAGEEGNIDEWARRVATIATSGFSSEWLTAASQQFGGQSFFKPIMDAMQGGDEGALKAAANDLLTRNVTALWDVETIKARVRQQLQEQNLRQQIIDQVQAELSAEGVDVSPESVAAVAGGATQAAGGLAQANQATADMGLTAGTTQAALDNLGVTLSTITDVKIMALIAKTSELQAKMGELSVGVNTASTEMITAMSTAVPKMQQVIKVVNWGDLGRYIDQGLAKGITENENLVLEKLKGLARRAIRDAQDELGIRSPSTKFEYLGDMSVAGFLKPFDASGGLIQQAYDKLFGIDRSKLGIAGIARYARQEVEDYQDDVLQLADSKGQYIRTRLEKIFKAQGSSILASADPTAEMKRLLSEVIQSPEKIGVTQKDLNASAWKFMQLVNKGIAKFSAEFQKMVIEGSRKAIDLAGSLSDIATAGAQQLNGEIDMLVQLLNTGASEFMLDGQIYSAAEATDLLNAKMAEQAAIQDDLLQLQQSQNQLNFLEKQLGLIETISKAGLNPADVLGGADLSTVSGLVGATNAAIQAIIGQVSSDIGAYTPVSGSQTINNHAVNLNMGGVSVNNSMDVGALTALIQRTVASGFG